MVTPERELEIRVGEGVPGIGANVAASQTLGKIDAPSGVELGMVQYKAMTAITALRDGRCVDRLAGQERV